MRRSWRSGLPSCCCPPPSKSEERRGEEREEEREEGGGEACMRTVRQSEEEDVRDVLLSRFSCFLLLFVSACETTRFLLEGRLRGGGSARVRPL